LRSRFKSLCVCVTPNQLHTPMAMHKTTYTNKTAQVTHACSHHTCARPHLATPQRQHAPNVQNANLVHFTCRKLLRSQVTGKVVVLDELLQRAALQRQLHDVHSFITKQALVIVENGVPCIADHGLRHTGEVVLGGKHIAKQGDQTHRQCSRERGCSLHTAQPRLQAANCVEDGSHSSTEPHTHMRKAGAALTLSRQYAAHSRRYASPEHIPSRRPRWMTHTHNTQHTHTRTHTSRHTTHQSPQSFVRHTLACFTLGAEQPHHSISNRRHHTAQTRSLPGAACPQTFWGCGAQTAPHQRV